MKEKLLWGSLIFLAIYMLLPWIATRIFGWGVYRKGRARNQVALTFDDGPDPNYTPLLLDLLKRHSVTATFFVLGSKAEKHPDLIARIHAAGHQIGIHNYTHLSNWLMTPWKVRRKQISRSADIVERITGERPTFYRPPWGVINIVDFLLKRQYEIVLWSLMVSDWNSRVARTKMKKRLIRNMTHGSVVLLHDSGETFGADLDAPKYMLQALDDVLEELKVRSYSYVRIDEMFGAGRKTAADTELGTLKRLLVSFWMLWEKAFIKLFHIVPIDEKNPFLQLRVREYHGSADLLLEDGEQIRKGDLVAELHLNNDMLFQIGKDARTSVHLAIQLIRRTEQLLPQINRLLQNDPQYQGVKGLYAVSMIHRGTRQLGFTVVDLPKGLFSFATHLYLRLLMYIIHPQGKDRLKTKSELLVPKIIAISRKELMNRYAA